ncbi:glycoprotein-N-acetylgalactosamine 3-beta-galactosyltransferase 1-like [Argiope bruennichi]|uniref:Glycoprotein-N-acetylgalactosamine like protein n=1 Tax=Argiope bruennichi TaxID=94029 RepID=A0A8T0G2H9_ARGBR|nr:glycoprotein-N-acetylgalactosamine 3-beta-galactosyltransferase 1-like [Argiope bruennichi]KAF8796250.1 Glycoprotein-N-acetylgalactosamine like protein [Argiope bruennichi]
MELCGAFQNRLFLFSCACLSGILFALVWRKYEQTVQISAIRNHYTSALRKSNYNGWLEKHNFSKVFVPEENLRYGENKLLELESVFLFKSTPVLCLIFVNSHNGAEAVKQTWAKHCNIVTFFGRFVDEKIPVMKVPPVTSFEGFCYAFTHVYHKYNGQFNWVLIADDFTYAIIENLRFYVAPLNSSMPYYLGHPVKDFSNLYNVGSAGIVLSKGSFSLLHSVYSTADDCRFKRPPSWYFDQSIGKILHAFNVHPVDTRDPYLRGRFNPFSVETMLIPGSISVFSSYWRTSAFLSEEGMNCCSDRAITFHGLLPSKHYLMEFLQYHLLVFRNSLQGIGNKPPTDKKRYISNKLNSKELDQVGEPFIQLVDRDWVKSNNKKKQKSHKTLVENIWNELFGS